MLPLILNVLQFRRDLEHLHRLTARQGKVAPQDLLRHGAPRVSFLVAAWNEESTLRSCLEAILGLNYPNLELILCAGGTDRTWEIAQAIADARLILLAQEPAEGKQRSLARGLERATGEVVYLLDAGGRITAQAFARVLDAIVNGGEEAVTCSPCTPYPAQLENAFVVNQCAGRIYTSLHQPEYCSGILGANSAIRRSALEKAGGFRRELRGGVDYDLGKRLLARGFRIRYEARASFPVEFHTDIRGYLRQQARWLRNVVIHGMRFGAYGEVASCLATSLIGLAMLVVPFLPAVPAISPSAARTLGVTWAIGFSHAFFSRVRYLRVAARWLGIRLPRRAIALLPVFLLIDFVAWTIPLFQYPLKRWREVW